MAWTAETKKAIDAEKEKMLEQLKTRLEKEMADSRERAEYCKQAIPKATSAGDQVESWLALTEHNAELGAYHSSLKMIMEVLKP